MLVWVALGLSLSQPVLQSGARPMLTLLFPVTIGLLLAANVALTVWRRVEWAECEQDLFAILFSNLALFGLWGCSLAFATSTLKKYRQKLAALEGDLPARLLDDSLRLLRVEWLCAQPAAFRIRRRQEMPDEAFWSPAKAEALLKQGKVAALSYRWLDPKRNDPDGFALSHLLDFYRSGRNATRRPALMIDFASLPQVDPDGRRTEDEQVAFDQGLKVMSNMYASPRVLVLQLKKMPPDKEAELRSLGGVAPADRPDLIPYAGAGCRSGWCTSESALTLLFTEGGGHAHELGVGPVRVGSRWERPTVDEMRTLFRHESTRFYSDEDRAKVSKGYLELRKLTDAFEEQRNEFVTTADRALTEDDGGRRVCIFSIVMVLLFALAAFLPAYVVVAAGNSEDRAPEHILLTGTACAAVYLIFPLGFILLSRVLRTHVAAVLCCRPRDRLPHSFHWSLCKPPFRPRRLDSSPPGEGVLFVPAWQHVKRAQRRGLRHSALSPPWNSWPLGARHTLISTLPNRAAQTAGTSSGRPRVAPFEAFKTQACLLPSKKQQLHRSASAKVAPEPKQAWAE